MCERAPCKEGDQPGKPIVSTRCCVLIVSTRGGCSLPLAPAPRQLEPNVQEARRRRFEPGVGEPRGALPTLSTLAQRRVGQRPQQYTGHCALYKILGGRAAPWRAPSPLLGRAGWPNDVARRGAARRGGDFSFFFSSVFPNLRNAVRPVPFLVRCNDSRGRSFLGRKQSGKVGRPQESLTPTECNA